jgi:CTP:molybdopterin cytidylyltransferase MocA
VLLAVAVMATASARDAHDTDDRYVLAVLIEGNRPAVMRAIAEEHGTVLLDVEETGTLRVAFDVDSPEDLLELQRRLRAREITAIVPGPGVPLTPT